MKCRFNCVVRVLDKRFLYRVFFSLPQILVISYFCIFSFSVNALEQNEDLEKIKSLAMKGDPIAQNELGAYYKKKGDDKLSYQWLKKAADNGCAQAQHNLAHS